MSKLKLKTTILYLGIFITISYGFIKYIAEYFSYEGYVYIQDNARIAIGTIAIVICALATPTSSNAKYSDIFYHFMMMSSIIPLTVIFCFEQKSSYFYFSCISAYLLTIFIPATIPKLKFKNKGISNVTLAYILFFASSAVIFTIFIMGGGKYFNLNPAKVYEFRTDASSNLPKGFGYLLPLIGKVFIPIAIVLFLKEKKYILLTISFAFSIILFGLTAHKSILFYPILLALMYYLIYSNRWIEYFLIIMLAAIISSLAILSAGLNGNEGLLLAGSLLFRRMLILPAELTYSYYEFFSENNFLLWSNSSITFGLINSDYDLTMANIIGEYRLNNSETSANTGWLGSGYGQAGLAGMYIYAIIISIIMKIIESLEKTAKEKKLVAAFILIPTLTFITSSDLLTALVTHGLIFSIIIANFLKKQ